MDGPHIELNAQEARVLGAMTEKAMTTADNYPMSLNAVVVACNQVSNRDPIVEFSEAQVELILRELADRGLAKMVHRPGDRVVKYRHDLGGSLEIDDKRLALLAVLLLRGPQTPGELRQRTTRYVEFTGLPEIEITLEEMRGEGLVRRLERRPGQKENRYLELLSPRRESEPGQVWDEETAVDRTPAAPISTMDTPAAASERDEIEDLRAEIAALRDRFETLLGQLGVDDL